MKKTLLAAMAMVCAVGCGDDPNAMKVAGNVRLTVHQTGQQDGSTTFNFPEGTIVDAPPGIGRGFFGTCARTTNGWAVSIARADSGTDGLRKIDLASASGTGAGTANGGVTASLSLGTSVFAANASCTGMATPSGTNGLNVTARCVGLTASNDLRTVDGDITLTLSNCTVR